MTSSIKIALVTCLLTGVFTLAGGAAGALISGHYQERSSKISAAKDLRLGCIKNSLAREARLRKTAEKFFASLSNVVVTLSDRKSTEQNYWNSYVRLQASAYRMAAYAPPKLSLKTVGISFDLLTALQGDHSETDRVAALKQMNRDAKNLPVEYEDIMNSFEATRKSCG